MDPQNDKHQQRAPHLPRPSGADGGGGDKPRRRSGVMKFLPFLVAGLLGFLLVQKIRHKAQQEAELADRVAAAQVAEEAATLIDVPPVSESEAVTAIRPFDPAFIFPRPHDMAKVPLALRFDHPLGSERGAFSYNAQPFMKNRHLGDDLNGIGGWNSDLGDPVYAAGRGRVVFAGQPSEGWGNMVLLAHRVSLPEGGTELIQTVYAHLQEVFVFTGENVARGEQLGTVGNANGNYLAHLHFEVRGGESLDPGAGYDLKPLGRRSPEEFLEQRAPTEQTLFNRDPALGAGMDVRVEAE